MWNYLTNLWEAELRSYFEQFGKVEDIEWPYDKQTKARRNFAFIVFEEEEAADRASATPKQTFGGREVGLYRPELSALI